MTFVILVRDPLFPVFILLKLVTCNRITSCGNSWCAWHWVSALECQSSFPSGTLVHVTSLRVRLCCYLLPWELHGAAEPLLRPHHRAESLWNILLHLSDVPFYSTYPSLVWKWLSENHGLVVLLDLLFVNTVGLYIKAREFSRHIKLANNLYLNQKLLFFFFY